MQYTILTATFSTKVYTNPSATGSNQWRPFLNQSNISFQNAQMGTVMIEDDDATFGSLTPSFYDDPGLATGQSLVNAATFGTNGTVVPAGTRMSYFQATILEDPNGNRFHVFFPTIQDLSKDPYPIEVGDRHTVMIIAQPTVDGTGNTVWPEFRTDVLYRARGTHGVSINNTSTRYDLSMQAPDCFAEGTLIETASGPRAIEGLAVGDLVLTRDHGPQPIRWIGGARLSQARLQLMPKMQPIRIRKDALGRCMPQQDLLVSPQHRVLIRSVIARRMFGAEEVLVAAKHLTGVPGIETVCPAEGVSYFHILLDRHELIRANGSWSETLFLGPQVMGGANASALQEVAALFPELATSAEAAGARPFIAGREGRKLAERHLKNGKALVC
ncbi:Hint domain-containing protein [Paracoccus sulfuroxidans]|uniref:Hint domain-containing protein n=1 Tax=Paracoccus sulfuroxidans TaxID=384678 RepID=A0A562NXY0_9RHOB|nr:Hint domain-containing protein [Paracoccus sulfuroxidans]TWI37078.1 Hint domain-containing protein [Paracoccus sulfuroxidans]